MDWEATYSFWEWSDDRMGLFHMYAAIAALCLGPTIFLNKKGNFIHRLLGLSYVFSMLSANTTALVIYDFTGGINFFHIAAIVSLATSIGGLVSILTYSVTKRKSTLGMHIEFMSWSYFGLFLAAAAEVFTRGVGPQIDSYQTFWFSFAVVMVVVGAASNVAAVKLIRRVKKEWLESLPDAT
jgi:uncharacterized membrane protein